jgi:hypothetical protein
MGAKQPPRWFYTVLRSRRGRKNENYRELVGDGEEREAQQELNVDLFYEE